MDNAMPLQQWVDFLGSEYLGSFIKDGGAAVKFAATLDDSANDLALTLAEQSRSRGYTFVNINALHSRVHMPQDIFFTMAKQLDWRLLARRTIIELAKSREFLIDAIDPSEESNIYMAIGQANQLDGAMVLQTLRVDIQHRVFQNRNMARDFRVAMAQLCLAEDSGESDGSYNGQPLIDWLTGENTRISNVRHFSVHTPINRNSARHFIESAFYWINYAGYAGVVLLLDNTRVTLARNPRDGTRFYSKAMAMEHYELLRELIDSADRLKGVLVVVAASPDFLDEDTNSKGFGAYPALMTRVMNDVRDKNLVNPMASLVRLYDTEGEQ